jgi:hypothetical protein
LHAFEQGGLGFGGGAVDFIGQHDVRKDRTGLKAKCAFAAGRTIALFGDNIGAHDIGWHQIGRKLDTSKFQRECI